MTESTNPISAAGELAGFPDEAFECPYCGQMLAPSCRVCVSCKLPIDPARIQRKREEAEAAAIEAKPELPRVRFNWSILLAVLGVFLFIAIVTSLLVGPADAPTAMQVMLFVCAGWVTGMRARNWFATRSAGLLARSWCGSYSSPGTSNGGAS